MLREIWGSTMPVHDSPFTACTFATNDVTDALAAVLLSVHASGAHILLAATAAPTLAKVEKVRRPTVSAAGSNEDWSYFLSRWADYKAATKVTGKDCVIQLLECCDEELRKDLTRSAGGTLTDKTEIVVTEAIKTLAARKENTMLARVALIMRQDRDEPIRSFGARIRGQAGVCKYTLECPGCNINVKYTDQIIKDVLARRLTDPEIQLDLLGDMNQDMSLEDVLKFVEAKESGKRSASRLLRRSEVNTAVSSRMTSGSEMLTNTESTNWQVWSWETCSSKSPEKRLSRVWQ